MKTHLVDKEIKYEGWQLSPHWIYKNFKIQGDVIVAFKGECNVKLAEMVDIEDVINNEPIYSKNMLSFITEQFNIDLIEGVFRQRLLICIIKEVLENKNPLDIVAYQYDLVCNGYELGSGAVRNHDPEIMVKAFEIAGYGEEEVMRRFPALYKAFHYGAPPHAGAAPGLDRMVMLIADEPNIREVIAFPKNKKARDLLMNAPSEVTEDQLRDVRIKIDLI